jgi:hypothetical protein
MIRFKINIKKMKYLLLLSLAGAVYITGHTQQNPAALDPLLSKTPLAGINDDFIFSFKIGNNGTVAISGADDFNRMRFDMTLGKCVPIVPNGGNFIDALSGAAKDYFTITYNQSINTYTGIQKASLGFADMKNLMVHAKVTQTSSAPNAAEIGVSVDVTPNVDAQAAGQTQIDDDVAFFTYTLSVLPVAALDLKAALDNNKAVLVWHTLSENNTAYFQVERSDDGNNFYSVGKVTAAGNSNTANTYSFTDPNLFSSAAYYRIRLYDKDGKTSLSNIETLTKAMIKGIGLFPNPANDFVTVTGLGQNQVIIVFDYKGSKLRQINTRGNSERIGVKQFAAGTYMIQVLDNGKVIATKKLIKN